MKYLFRLLLFLIVPLSLLGQTTAVTGTATDPDGFAWAGGSAQFTLHNDAGGTVRQNGVPLTADQMNKNVALDGSGSFSVGLATNSTLTPVGTQWTLLICSAASAPCQTFANFTALGASMSLTTSISSQIQALRFPASYTARGYGDVEISPLPPPGGTYFNLQSAVPRFWNGTIWTAYGSGGGGGGTPSAPANSFQFANAAVNGFASNAGFFYDPTTSTVTTSINTKVAAMESVPRAIYDPWSTKYRGGLAAAIANTSGFTPTQVIQYTIDYAECDVILGNTTYFGFKIPLPTGRSMNISQLILWTATDLGGESFRAYPTLQHIDATKPMIRGAVSSDTITCPQDGSTHSPIPPGSVAGQLFVHNIGLSGMGATSAGANDIGIQLNGAADLAYQIIGAGNTFGAQAVVMDASHGLNNFIIYAGYPGSQMSGCASFTTGALPVANNIYGSCAAVQDAGIDNEMYYVYATDGASFLAGNGPGSCYPNCSAIGVSQNATAAFLFGQVSDIAVKIGLTSKVTNIRVDRSSMEGVRIGGGSNLVSFIDGFNACLSTNLQAAYNAGTATGCAPIVDNGQGNIIDHIAISGANGLFGPSYQECILMSNFSSGSGFGGLYSFLSYSGNPNNTTRNDMAYCGAFSGAVASGAATIPEATRELLASVPSGLVNMSGMQNVRLNSATPVTHITGGINGQRITITGIPGSSVVPGTIGLESISTCNGAPEIFDGFKVTEWKNQGGYQAPSFGPNNNWKEICNSPQQTPTHINFPGNPTIPNPYMFEIYGNTNIDQIPTSTINVVPNIHGPAAPSGQYCFVYKTTYPSGRYQVSNLSCTTVDLAHQTAGGYFGPTSPQATNYELYLFSNTTTSGIPIGKYPPYGGAPGQIFWDGPSVLALGGDGSTPPTPGLNYTGMYEAPWGVLLNTYNNVQPPCDAITRGRMWLVDGAGSNPDVYQGCIQTGGSSYTWANMAFGASGTTGFIPLYLGPGSIGNSHIDEVSNAGYDTFTQGIIINDTSGNGGNGIGTEGSAPPAGVGVDTLWADATNHQWMVNNNNTGSAAIATVPVGAPITIGNCVKGGANDTLVDAGAACGSGGGGVTPGTPTFVMALGGGTAPTATSLSAGSSDFSGFFNFTTGTCTAGVCPAPTVGVFTITYSRTYTPQLKCFIMPANLTAMGLANNVQLFTPIGQQTTAHFVAVSNAVGLPQSTAFSYYYHCDFQ